jgi:hypothetical protein
MLFDLFFYFGKIMSAYVHIKRLVTSKNERFIMFLRKTKLCHAGLLMRHL